MLTKFISGDNLRKSRLHDEKNNLIRFKRFILHAPLALVTGFLRILFDYRPETPWISYDAIEVLRKHLHKKSRVLEFGSGMSTIWYAKKAGEVYSVDDYRPWFLKIQKKIIERNINNISYHFSETKDDYINFRASDELGFDLIMVDGSHRSECLAQSLKLIRAGGIVYLDNSDKDSTERGGDMRQAETTLLQFARDSGAKIFYFTDFAPTQLFVQQGLMLKLPEGYKNKI